MPLSLDFKSDIGRSDPYTVRNPKINKIYREDPVGRLGLFLLNFAFIITQKSLDRCGNLTDFQVG